MPAEELYGGKMRKTKDGCYGRVNALLNTSAVDCGISISHCTTEDLPMLRILFGMAERRGKKTRSRIVAARIKQLDKGAFQRPKSL